MPEAQTSSADVWHRPGTEQELTIDFPLSSYTLGARRLDPSHPVTLAGFVPSDGFAVSRSQIYVLGNDANTRRRIVASSCERICCGEVESWGDRFEFTRRDGMMFA